VPIKPIVMTKPDLRTERPTLCPRFVAAVRGAAS
jgi:hypothetical protein